MATKIKIEYKELSTKPDGEHYRIPIVMAIAATSKAVLIDFGDKKEWLPSSVIIYGRAGKQRAVDMPEWLARKHKLI